MAYDVNENHMLQVVDDIRSRQSILDELEELNIKKSELEEEIQALLDLLEEY